jgi:hypothetical protein
MPEVQTHRRAAGIRIVTRHLIEEDVRRPEGTRPVPPSLAGLTEREARVLTLVAGGRDGSDLPHPPTA